MSTDRYGRPLSDDGQWAWNGTEWVPAGTGANSASASGAGRDETPTVISAIPYAGGPPPAVGTPPPGGPAHDVAPQTPNPVTPDYARPAYGGAPSAGAPGYGTGPAAARSRRKLMAALAAVLVVIAAGVVAVVLALQPSKPPTPAVPASLTAISQKGAIGLTWMPSKHADHYVLYRDDKVLKNRLSTPSYVDPLPNEDTSSHHIYYVIAVSNHDKISPKSNSVTQSPMLRDLTAAENAFIDKLPAGLASTGSCVPEVVLYAITAVDTAVHCEINDSSVAAGSVKPPGGFVAYRLATTADYQDDVKQQIADLPKDTDCQSGTDAAGTWSNGKGKTLGTIYCENDGPSIANSGPTLTWTVDAARTFVVLVGSKGNQSVSIRQLDTFWRLTPTVNVSA